MGAIGRRRVREALAWEYSAAELVRAYGEGLSVARRLEYAPQLREIR